MDDPQAVTPTLRDELVAAVGDGDEPRDAATQVAQWAAFKDPYTYESVAPVGLCRRGLIAGRHRPRAAQGQRRAHGAPRRRAATAAGSCRGESSALPAAAPSSPASCCLQLAVTGFPDLCVAAGAAASNGRTS
jgi:hypothetical protein